MIGERLALVVAALIATAAGAASPAEVAALLRDGDVLLQQSRSSQSAALEAATGSRWTHAALAFRRGDEFEVLEAVQYVKWTPLAEWIERGRDSDVVVLRPNGTTLDAERAKRLRSAAEAYLGRPYDLLFQWGDEHIYCSELVYKSYRDATGIEIGVLVPMGSFRLDAPAVQALIATRMRQGVKKDEPVVAPASFLHDDALHVVFSDDPAVATR